MPSAIALLCAPALALGGLLAVAAPGHAAAVATTCTVNGVVQTGTAIVGTRGVDHIDCAAGVALGTTVSGLGGVDFIEITGENAGTVNGGNGSDFIHADVNSGTINGGEGNDFIDICGENAGTINGGTGSDFIDAGENSGTIDGGTGTDLIEVAGGTGNTGSIKGGTGIDLCDSDPVGTGTIDCEF